MTRRAHLRPARPLRRLVPQGILAAPGDTFECLLEPAPLCPSPPPPLGPSTGWPDLTGAWRRQRVVRGGRRVSFSDRERDRDEGVNSSKGPGGFGGEEEDAEGEEKEEEETARAAGAVRTDPRPSHPPTHRRWVSRL
eukprot:tig00020675_g12699.t1